MLTRFYSFLLIICISISSVAQKTDRKLEQQLRQLTADFSEGGGAFGDGGADLAIGNSFAETDVHDVTGATSV